METAALEAMTRVKYKLEETDKVDIEFLSHVSDTYEYKITTYKYDIIRIEYIYITNSTDRKYYSYND